MDAQNDIPDRSANYNDDVRFKWVEISDSSRLMTVSKSYAPIEIIVYERDTDDELMTFLLESFDSLFLFSFQASNMDSLTEALNDQYRIRYNLGHPDLIEPDSDYLYRLPFEKGRKVKVNQGWNGTTSHNTEISKYAYDFNLEVGDPVHAAREGLVIKTVDWFTERGGPELRNAGNRILIMHDDGTIATYVHLDYKGVHVKRGDYVERGQKIGTSGLTGYTNGPHLHFVLRKERDISIPMYFEGYDGEELQKGKKYRVKN